MSSSALCSIHSLFSRLQLGPLQGCCYSWWSSHGAGTSNARVFYCNWAALSPIASHRHSSRCETSTSLHEPFNPKPLAAREAAPTPTAPGLSQCQPPSVLHDSFTSQNQYHLGDLHYQVQLPAQSTILTISGTLLTLRKHFPEDFTSVVLVSS